MNDKGRSCWTCAYQKLGGDTFLGVCTYFSTVGRENKEIPPHIVDIACQFWRAKQGAVLDGNGHSKANGSME